MGSSSSPVNRMGKVMGSHQLPILIHLHPGNRSKVKLFI